MTYWIKLHTKLTNLTKLVTNTVFLDYKAHIKSVHLLKITNAPFVPVRLIYECMHPCCVATFRSRHNFYVHTAIKSVSNVLLRLWWTTKLIWAYLVIAVTCKHGHFWQFLVINLIKSGLTDYFVSFYAPYGPKWKYMVILVYIYLLSAKMELCRFTCTV